MSDWPWGVLGVEPASDALAIKRAYAKKLKVTRPDDDPDGYQQLRHAYEVALDWAQRVAAEQALAAHTEPTGETIGDVPATSTERAAAMAPIEAAEIAAAATPIAAPSDADGSEQPRSAPVHADADELPHLIARIRRTLSDVDITAPSDLPAWWKRLGRDFALVPLAHRNVLSRQMAQFVAERPGFPDWLVERIADLFEWESDFRRGSEIQDTLGTRLAAMRRARGELVERQWRLLSVFDALARPGSRVVGAGLMAMFAPRLIEHYDELRASGALGRLRDGLRFEFEGLARQQWFLRLLLFKVIVLLPFVWTGITSDVWNWPPVLAWLGVVASGQIYLCFDAVYRQWKPLHGARNLRVSMAAGLGLGALWLGTVGSAPVQAHVCAFAALFLAHNAGRWRSIHVAFWLAPSIAFWSLGLPAPSWLTGAMALSVLLSLTLLDRMPERVLAAFRVNLSEVPYGWAGWIALVFLLRAAGPALTIATALVMPLVVSVHARSFGRWFALNNVATATALTVMLATPETVLAAWLAALVVMCLATVLWARLLERRAVKIIQRNGFTAHWPPRAYDS
mgnify:CR=1 FL=1